MKFDDKRDADKYEIIYDAVGAVCVIIPILIAIFITNLMIKK